MRETLKRPLHRYVADRRRSYLVGKLRQYAHTFINWVDNFEYDVELNGERFVLERLDPEVVFDVGANVGQWALMASAACPRAQIHCFEIVPDTFEKLKAVTRPNVTLNNFGLSDGPQYANSVTLEAVYPSDNTQELLRHAVEALRRIYRRGYEYRKAGVMLSGMVPAEQTTGRLFDDETLERFRKVMPVVDMLNKKYGRDTVRLAGVNPKGRWRTKAAKRSPRYTTKLAEVPRLK